MAVTMNKLWAWVIRNRVRIASDTNKKALRFNPVQLHKFTAAAGTLAIANAAATLGEQTNASEKFFDTSKRTPSVLTAVRVLVPSAATAAEVDTLRGGELRINSSGIRTVVPLSACMTRLDAAQPSGQGPAGVYALPDGVYFDCQNGDVVELFNATAASVTFSANCDILCEVWGVFARDAASECRDRAGDGTGPMAEACACDTTQLRKLGLDARQTQAVMNLLAGVI